MSSQLNFCLPNSDNKIFLHPIDQEFENKSELNNFDDVELLKQSLLEEGVENSESFEVNVNVNVKFLLALDHEENFDDLSTEDDSLSLFGNEDNLETEIENNNLNEKNRKEMEDENLGVIKLKLSECLSKGYNLNRDNLDKENNIDSENLDSENNIDCENKASLSVSVSVSVSECKIEEKVSGSLKNEKDGLNNENDELTKTMTIQSEIKRIQNETMSNFRQYQLDTQYRMMMMRCYYDNLYKVNYADVIKRNHYQCQVAQNGQSQSATNSTQITNPDELKETTN